MTIRVALMALTLLFATTAAAQEIEITLSWGGSEGGCAICGDQDYACSGPYGDWNDGQATFVDPLPSGDVLGGVIATIQGVGEDSSTRIWLSGDPVGGSQLVASPFDCEACQPTTFTALGGVWPGYVYGGTNTLWIDTSANPEICVSRVELLLYHGPAEGDDDDATGDDDDDSTGDDDDSAGDDGGGGGGGRSRSRGCDATGGGASPLGALLFAGGLVVRRRR